MFDNRLNVFIEYLNMSVEKCLPLFVTCSFFITIYSVLFAFYLIVKLRKNSKHVKFASQLTGPTPIPIFGNSLQFIAAGTKACTELLPYWTSKYGPVFRIWFGNTLTVVISEVDYLKEIFMNKTLQLPPPSFDSFSKFFDLSVSWPKEQKSKLWPYLTDNTLRTFIPQINDRIEKLLADIRQYENRGEIDVTDMFFDTSFDIFTKTQFEYEMDSKNKSTFNYRSLAQKVLKLGSIPILFPWFDNQICHQFISKILLYFVKSKYRKYVKMIIKNKLLTIRQAKKLENQNEIDKSSFLWRSYEYSLEKKDDNIPINEALTLLFGGVNSLSTAISFVSLMIAMYPEVQNKLFEEIIGVFGEDKRRAQYDDIKRLPYMDKVIKETFRLVSANPVIFRYVPQDTQIGYLANVYQHLNFYFPKNCLHNIPGGTTLILNIFAIHHNPSFYPKPYEFNPHNFDDKAIETRSDYSFVPFSGGQRKCLGKYLTLMQMKLTLVAILRKYVIRTPLTLKDIKLYTPVITQNMSGYPITFQLRSTSIE